MTLGTNQIVTEASVEEAEVNIDKDSIVSLTIQGKKGMKKNREVKSMEIETLKEAGVETKKGAMTEIGRAVMSHTEKKKNLELLTVRSLQTVEQVKKGGVVINQRVRIGVMIKIKLGTEIEKKKKRKTGTTRTGAGTTVIKVKANDESTAFLNFLILFVPSFSIKCQCFFLKKMCYCKA